MFYDVERGRVTVKTSVTLMKYEDTAHTGRAFIQNLVTDRVSSIDDFWGPRTLAYGVTIPLCSTKAAKQTHQPISHKERTFGPPKLSVVSSRPQEAERTGRLCRIHHRKWRETKLQPNSWPGLALLGCSLVYLYFRC